MLLLAAGKISYSYELSDFRGKYDMCERHCLMAYGCSEVAWTVTSGVTVPGHQYEMATYLA